MPNRYIFIGDLHGCHRELEELLDKVEPSSDDLVVSVGDFLAKGPGSEQCVRTWMDKGYLTVKGNIDKAFCDWVDGKRKVTEEEVLASFRALRDRDDIVDYLRSLPLYLDIPEISVLAVHGGLYPEMRIDGGKLVPDRKGIIALRWLRRNGDGWIGVSKEDTRSGDRFWSEVWDGDRTVVYGHTPQKSGRPRIDAKAIGIDTGCVFGGYLTAAVYNPDEDRWEYYRVEAVREYASWPARI